jgi:hypothetical protein
MPETITKHNVQARVNAINTILAELGVDIDASISSQYGGVSLVGDNGSHNYSKNGHIPKRELYNQLQTVVEVLYEISRQQRGAIKIV